MTDRGKEPAREDVRTIDALWTNQEKVNRRIDELAAEIQRLAIAVRRGFNPARAAETQRHWEETPVHRRALRRENEEGQQRRCLQINPTDRDELEDETPPRRGYYDPKDSSEGETDH